MQRMKGQTGNQGEYPASDSTIFLPAVSHRHLDPS